MPTTQPPFPRPDAASIRELAVRHGCDPRSILNALEGRPVRGLAGRRARAAAADWLAATLPHQTHHPEAA